MSARYGSGVHNFRRSKKQTSLPSKLRTCVIYEIVDLGSSNLVIYFGVKIKRCSRRWKQDDSTRGSKFSRNSWTRYRKEIKVGRTQIKPRSPPKADSVRTAVLSKVVMASATDVVVRSAGIYALF